MHRQRHLQTAIFHLGRGSDDAHFTSFFHNGLDGWMHNDTPILEMGGLGIHFRETGVEFLIGKILDGFHVEVDALHVEVTIVVGGQQGFQVVDLAELEIMLEDAPILIV